MKTGFRGLDDLCATCRLRVGDHTMDGYDRCLGTVAQDLPYEDVPAGPIPLTINGVEMLWADHIVARSCVIAGNASGGQVSLAMPAVIFTFQFGSSTGPSIPVTEVALVGSPEVLRKVGRLLRDTCNGAANAAERSL